jgi:hypothetical protein
MRIDKELIEKIEKITMVDYEVVNNETGCLIPVENIEAVIEDLLLEYNALKEKLEDAEEAGNPYEEYDTYRESMF